MNRIIFIIVAALGFYLFAVLPIYLHETNCIKESATQAQSIKSNNKAYVTPVKNFTVTWLCNDMRLTDLFLVFFTYCLVLVGYSQLKSSEKILRQSERAHIFAKIENCGVPPQVQVMITPGNFGRSPAIIKEICGKFSIKKPWPYTTYNGGQKIPFDNVLGIDKNEPVTTVGFSSLHIGPQFFFGYILYEDIFCIRRKSRFCTKVSPGVPFTVPFGPKRLNKCN